MGYYSRYTITVIGAPIETIETLRVEVQQTCPDAPTLVLHAGNALQSEERWTWYGYREELASVSAVLRDVTIVLDREGEESGDIERCYFRNGRSASIKPQLVWPEPPEGF